MKMTELLTMWGDLKVQEKKMKDAQSEIRNEIGKIMHKKKSTKEVIITDDEESWLVSYTTTSRKKVNYDMLAEIISDEDFEDVVEVTSGTTLSIRKSKAKKNTKDYTKPPKHLSVEETVKVATSKAPKGQIG